MGYLLSWLTLSKSATDRWLTASEILLLVAGLILTWGAVGEYLEDHGKLDKLPRWMRWPKLIFILMVVGGLVGEFLGDGGVFAFSYHLQSIEDSELERLGADADKLENRLVVVGTAAGVALDNSGKAVLLSTSAIGVARGASAMAKSFEKDIVSAKEQAASAESHLAEAVSMAKAEEVELLRLEKQVAPRVLSVDQQRKISVALKAFKDRAVNVSSYGLDGEGAAVATQIMAALAGAGIKPADHRAETIVSGGFEFGVHVRGPATEQTFVLAIANALSSIGNLQVSSNKGTARPGMVMAAGVTMAGPVTMAGASGPPGPDGPTAPGTPVTIAVGIKPVEILLAK